MMPVAEFLRRIRAQRASFEKASVLLADRFAPNFSPFEFVRQDELGLSLLIAWMLSPTGSHGQGERFLEAFVQYLPEPWSLEICRSAQVEVEAPTSWIEASSRRIDILVRSGQHAIAIENKPWAIDQVEQVSDYLRQLDRVFQGRRCLVYLSHSGARPSEASISLDEAARRTAARQLQIMAYGDLVPWIEACKAVCRADRITSFLNDFSRFIQQGFLGVREMNARDNMVDEITSTPGMVGPALQVILAADRIKRVLIERLKAQLHDECTKLGWTFAPRAVSDKASEAHEIRFHDPSSVAFGVSLGKAPSWGLVYGVVGVARSDPRYAPMRKSLEPLLGKTEDWDNWPWASGANINNPHLPIDADWGHAETPWLRIEDGNLARMIVDLAKRAEAHLRAERFITPRLPPPVA